MTVDPALPYSLASEIRSIRSRLLAIETKRGGGSSSVTLGGSAGSVQYSDGSNLAGDSTFTYNSTTGALSVGTRLILTNSSTAGEAKITLWDNGSTTYGFGISSSDLDYFSDVNHRWHTGSGGGSAGTEVMSLTGGANTPILTLNGSDSSYAEFRAHGTSQGTGVAYVGQSSTYGGGVFYNGDGSPAYATGEASDRISFFRRNNGSNEVVFSYPYNSNAVSFRATPDVNGTAVSLSNHTHSYAATNHTHSYYSTGSSVRALYYNGYGNSEVTAYQTSGNWQAWTGGWATHIICNHGNGSNYYNQTLIMPFWGVPSYMRKTGGSNSGVYTFWSTENAGSGIDWNTAATIATVNGTSAFYYNQALQTRSTGQRGGVGMWADNSNNSAVQLRPSGGYLYVRTWNDGTGIIMRAGSYQNYSTIRDKQDVTDWGASKSVGAAVDPAFAIDATEMVRNLRPVKFRRTKHHRLSADIQNHSERRAKALDRLNIIRRSKGLEDYHTDETVHRCGRDCEGSTESPCKLYRDWEKGEVGFIAEEVVNVVPDAVWTDDDEQPLTVDPMVLIATCVKALQEIDTRLNSLEAS
jgi:hypothetical protein